MTAAAHKARRTLNELVKLEEAGIDRALAALMSHREGRDLLWWIMSLGELGTNPFTPNALTMSFNCGSLNVAQQLQARIIKTAPDFYVQALKEKENDRTHRASLTSVANSDRSSGAYAESDFRSDEDAAD